MTIYGNLSCQKPKKEIIPYEGVSRDKGSDTRLSNQCSFFILKNQFASFKQPWPTTLQQPWPTTLQQPWTNWLAPTMWTLVFVKIDLDEFIGPKLTPTTWIFN